MSSVGGDIEESKVFESKGNLIEQERKIEDLQEQVRMRDEFFALTSHELRTYMTSLRLQIQALIRLNQHVGLRNVAQEKVDRMLEISDHQIRDLDRLVNELLDLARIMNGKLILTTQLFDLRVFIQGVAKHLTESLAQGGCQLILHLEDSLHGKWDQSRIKQVLMNLLDNAIKYGKGKPIIVEASKVGPETVLLKVQDHGIGISKEKQKDLFQKFHRLVGVSEFDGLGLGLYIVQKIVEAHGGSIQLESELGKGSLFTVQLPLCVS